MADCYAVTSEPLPPALHGGDAGYSIRTLSERERLAIEDYFFTNSVKVAIDHASTAVIVPQTETGNAAMEDFAVLVEFALGILSVSGFQPITIVAIGTASTCSNALQRSYREKASSPKFPRKVVKTAAVSWVRRFFSARRNAKDKLHITADRFVRYLRMDNSSDALVDLCICLESLIEGQSEISFRFATCLAKVCGAKNSEEVSDFLGDLYDLRSKIVHGTDFTKEHRKVVPNIDKLRLAARAILTTYILYMTAHTKDEWKKYLRNSLFA